MCAKVRSVKTGVDRLIEYLKRNGKTKIKTIAKDLELPETTVKSWIDFLLEEERVLLDYEFTTPYAELTDKERAKIPSNKHHLSRMKKHFKKKAKDGEVSDEKSEFLWKKYIETELDSLKDFFRKEAQKRDVEKVEDAWKDYKAGVLG